MTDDDFDEDDDQYEPTPGELGMARSTDQLVQRLLAGELVGLAVCAVNTSGQEAFFYLNSVKEDVLRGPMEQLKVTYELNRGFGRRNTAPRNNASFRSH